MAAMGLLLLLVSSHPRQITLTPLVPLVAFLVCLLWNLTFTHPAAEFNWLREFRLAVLLAITIYLQRCQIRADFAEALLQLPWIKLTVALSVFAIVQYIGTHAGQNFFVPAFMFTNSDDPALGSSWADHAEEHSLELAIRPASLYSEPSYFGLILLFVHLIVILRGRSTTSLIMSAGVIAVSALIASGFAVATNVTIAMVYYNRRSAINLLIFFTAAVAVAFFVWSLDFTPQRIQSILDGSDASTSIRIVQPFNIIAEALTQSPFGFPVTGASSYFVYTGELNAYSDRPFQNGFFNLILSFGLLSFPILVLLFSGSRTLIGRLFILFALFQNGAYSEVDKVVLISIVSLLTARYRDRPKLASSAINPPGLCLSRRGYMPRRLALPFGKKE